MGKRVKEEITSVAQEGFQGEDNEVEIGGSRGMLQIRNILPRGERG